MSTLIRRLDKILDHWLFDVPYVSTRGLAAYRIFLGLYLLLFFTPGHESNVLTGYASLPRSFYGPPLGPMMFFNGLPSSHVIDAGTLILTVALVMVCIGWQTRAATAVASLALFWLVGIENSLGKLNESQTLTALMLAIMVFSSWGRALSVDSILARRRGESPPKSNETPWVGQLIALILGCAFASAGLEKLLGGWLSLSSHATEFYADQFLFRGDGTSLTKAMLDSHIDVLWEFADWATVIFEVGFIVAVFKRGWLRGFCAYALLFHSMNYAILNISFLTLPAMYALFLPWDRLLELRPLRSLAEMLDSWSPKTLLVPGLFVAMAASAGILMNQLGSPVVAVLDLTLPFQDPRTEVLYGALMVVFVLYSANLMRELAKGPLKRRPGTGVSGGA